MDKERGGEKVFSRKRSFTFGAYGGVDKFIGTEQARSESIQHSILDILDPPPNETRPLLPAASGQRDTELFEIIEKLQGSRLDEQRCEFPPPLKLLKISGVLPLIIPPKCGGYWIDPPLEKFAAISPSLCEPGQATESYDIMERDLEAKIYRECFRSKYHHSFTAVDTALGSLVLSVCLEEEEKRIRVILRMKECTLHGVFSVSLFHHFPNAVELAKMLCNNVTVTRFEPVSYLKAPELITAFDEHRVSQNFKFGVLYQKEGQLTEKDILSNNDESEEFQDFLSILGETVKLQGFTGPLMGMLAELPSDAKLASFLLRFGQKPKAICTGLRFRGGLDVCHGQTGSKAVYTSFSGREIMFHVATKLPFTEGDTQQLQRKRHIGNDIVALVYQEGQVPFVCDIISSHFLHCFIIVRRVHREDGAKEEGRGLFQVCVTAREDVPPFGPPLPDPPTFTQSSQLREFLLTKLINAEISCYRAERFNRLELRTRSSLLEVLQSELSTQSQCMLGDSPPQALSQPESGRAASEGGGGFIENFKRAIRVRSHSFDNLGVPKKTVGGGGAQKPRATHTNSCSTEKEGESESTNKQSGSHVQVNESPGSKDAKDQSSPQEDV